MAKQSKCIIITEYDNMGKLICKYQPGDCKIDRNDDGRIIHIINTTSDHEQWYKYDERGNLTYFKNNKGTEWEHRYDERNNLIYRKIFFINDYCEYWNEYDESNRLIHSIDSSDFECEWKYDERGNIIYQKDYENEFWKEYDERGNLIHEKYSDGNECFYEYDECGNNVFSKEIEMRNINEECSSYIAITEFRKKYDSNNILIYEEMVKEILK